MWLAETASDPMISGNWIIALIGAASTAVAAILGKGMGRREGETAREVTLKKPVPTVVTREEPLIATQAALQEHIDNTKEGLDQVWEAITAERGVARESLGKIHARIDQQSQATAKVQGTVDEVKATVGRLLDIALNRKPGTGR